MAWVMPSFTYNNYGPIFAENGTGNYIVGQGDFKLGNGVDPVLYVQVGNKKAHYIAPTYKKREWNHIAIVRWPAYWGSYSFLLYVNGDIVFPIDSNVSFSTTETIANAPSGTLRFGRRTSGTSDASRGSWQYYGFIDDVAVYTAALSEAEIEAAMASPFTHSSLLAGWTFNEYDAKSYQRLSPKLKRPFVRQSPAYSVAVPSVRDDSDAGFFDGWLYVAPLQRSYSLPFQAGEVWKVTQGPDDPSALADPSHIGRFAFVYDLSRVPGPGGALLLSSAAGDIIDVGVGLGLNSGGRERDNVVVQTAPRELVSYLHLETDSYTDVFLGGDPEVEPQNGGPILSIDADEPFGRVGDGAKHVHIGARDALGTIGATIPLAFTDYEVSNYPDHGFVHVVRGMPKKGQYIRRPN